MSLPLSSLPDGLVVRGAGTRPSEIPFRFFPLPFRAAAVSRRLRRPCWPLRGISLVILRYRAVEPACLVPRLYGAAFAVKVLLEWLTPRYRALRVLRSTLTAPAAPKTGTYEARSVTAMPDKDWVSGACGLRMRFTVSAVFVSLTFWVGSDGRAPCCREPVPRTLARDRSRERRYNARIQSHRAAARRAQPSTRRIEAFAVSRRARFASASSQGVSPRVTRAKQRAHRYGLFSAPERNAEYQPKAGYPKIGYCAARQSLRQSQSNKRSHAKSRCSQSHLASAAKPETASHPVRRG